MYLTNFLYLQMISFFFFKLDDVIAQESDFWSALTF